MFLLLGVVFFFFWGGGGGGVKSSYKVCGSLGVCLESCGT